MRRFASARLSAVIGALCIATVSAAAMAQESQPAHESAPTAVAIPAEPAAWKAIEIGGRKGVNAYRQALDAASVRIGEAANEILGRPAFRYAGTTEKIELVIR